MKKFVKDIDIKILVIALISIIGLTISIQTVIGSANAWSNWVVDSGTFGDSSRVQVGGAYQWNSFYGKNVFPAPTINYQTTSGFMVYCTYTQPEMYGYSLLDGNWVTLWKPDGIHGPTNDPKSHQELVATQMGINQIKGICRGWFISWAGITWSRNVTAVVTAP